MYYYKARLNKQATQHMGKEASIRINIVFTAPHCDPRAEVFIICLMGLKELNQLVCFMLGHISMGKP